MKKTYKIAAIGDKLIVLPLSYLRLDELAIEVSKYLLKKKINQEVIFDLLPTKGLSSSRYISVYYSNMKFDFLTSKKINVSENVIEHCNNFYFKNIDLILESHLSRIDKQKVSMYLEEYHLIES